MQKKIILTLLCLLLIFSCKGASPVQNKEHETISLEKPDFPFSLTDYDNFNYPYELKMGKYYLKEETKEEPTVIINDKAIRVNWEDESYYFTADEIIDYSCYNGNENGSGKYVGYVFNDGTTNKLYKVTFRYGDQGNNTIALYFSEFDGGDLLKECEALEETSDPELHGVIEIAPFLRQDGTYSNVTSTAFITIRGNQITFDYTSYNNGKHYVTASNYEMNIYTIEEYSVGIDHSTLLGQSFKTINENGGAVYFTFKKNGEDSFIFTHSEADPPYTYFADTVFTLQE